MLGRNELHDSFQTSNLDPEHVGLSPSCVRASVRACLNARMHACMHARAHACMHACMHA